MSACPHGIVCGLCLWCLAALLEAESRACAALWEAEHRAEGTEENEA